jgi:hypothetical protein
MPSSPSWRIGYSSWPGRLQTCSTVISGKGKWSKIYVVHKLTKHRNAKLKKSYVAYYYLSVQNKTNKKNYHKEPFPLSLFMIRGKSSKFW